MTNDEWKSKLPSGGWKIIEKGGNRDSQYEKYDNQIVVIVSAVSERKNSRDKTPGHVYLTREVMKWLGNPKWIQVLENGDELGIVACKEGDHAAYAVSSSSSNTRPYVSCKKIIRDHGLRSGVYTAGRYDHPPMKMVTFNKRDQPSQP